MSKANNAITRIRDIAKDLDYLKGKAAGHEELKTLIAEFGEKLSEVENNIHMTKNQSRQDPLNYGIRINNRLAFLLADSQRGDYRPTDQSKEFFEVVKAELAKELSALNALESQYLSAINDKVKSLGIPMVSASED